VRKARSGDAANGHLSPGRFGIFEKRLKDGRTPELRTPRIQRLLSGLRSSGLNFGGAVWEATRTLPRPRVLLRIAAAFALNLALALGSRPARAGSGDVHEATTPARPNSSEARPSPGLSLRGFDLLATVGWGAATANVFELKLEPYGASFGLDLGYTWPIGFRLGGYFDQSLGHALPQHIEPRIGPESDFIADTSSTSGGLSVGWAVPVYALVLRYTLSVGVTAMRWEFPTLPTTRAVTVGDGNSPAIGVHFAPGVVLLWPYRWFETGIGYEYLAQSKSSIPSGFVAKLLIGVRL
jgi:hypothetical protein